MPQEAPLKKTNRPDDHLDHCISKATDLILSHQTSDGYWWYTLEANESINAEYILLLRYLGINDPQTEKRIAQRILSVQSPDGSWPLYYGAPGDLSTTIECYWVLKLMGQPEHAKKLEKARKFILEHGGLSKCRVFTRIHLAQFGLIPWRACPKMPSWFIHLPIQSPINIYEFSSWARACIIPLLVIMDVKKIRALPSSFLYELYCESSPNQVDWPFQTDKNIFSWENFFIQTDKALKWCEKIPFHFLQKSSLKKCEQWIRDHVAKTEDIYPALAYGAMALYSLGYPVSDPGIQKCLRALKSFQTPSIYQQCCISPVWDTPWVGTALIEADSSLAEAESLKKTARWLISKQIINTYGDWSLKNKNILPGGWSFEFENEYFPDVDDTIQVLTLLHRVDLPASEKKPAFQRGLKWLLSMQSKNGGWAAFDKDNTLDLVNKIPFSDHGACLDPPTPDVTGRTLELLSYLSYKKEDLVVKKALNFIENTQETWGPWWGRWGVNTIYGTWCVLQGLQAIGYDMKSARIQKALSWLESIQNKDGGFGESCHSYIVKKYVPLPCSIPSQTAWALMALIGGGKGQSSSAQKAAQFLMENQNSDGGWDEDYFTGTGFPGHFYIRYHGYRHYFPLLALAKYRVTL